MGKVQPARRCVACRKRSARTALFRVVRQPSGEVVLWTRPQHLGRSAYVCRNAECIRLALKREALQRSLGTRIPEGVKTQMDNWMSGSVPEPFGEQSKASEVAEIFNEGCFSA